MKENSDYYNLKVKAVKR